MLRTLPTKCGKGYGCDVCLEYLLLIQRVMWLLACEQLLLYFGPQLTCLNSQDYNDEFEGALKFADSSPGWEDR